jgi:hypothetical protein
LLAKKSTAWRGSTAASTSGARTIWKTPRVAMQTNHTSITGPKIFPTPVVPRLWIRKRMTRITIVIGSTTCSNIGVATASPSTAESTEIAGVMIPSP